MRLWKQHRFWEASRFAERSIQVRQIARDKANARFGLLWAQAAALSHDPKSLSLIKEVVRSGYYDAPAWEIAGAIFSDAGDPGRAEQHYEAAKELFQAIGDMKGVARVLSRMARTYADEGRFEEALSLAHGALGTDASFLVTRQTTEALIHSIQGRHADALLVLSEALPSSTGLARPYVLLGLASENLYLGNIEIAQKNLQEARVNAPKKEAFSIFVDAVTVRVLAQQNRTRASLVMLAQTEKRLMEYVAKRNGSRVLSAAWPPRPRMQASVERDAENDCIALAARIPMCFFYHAAGIATYDMGEYERSLQYWNRLLSIKPGRVEMVTILCYTGQCKHALGDVQAATEAYRDAVNIEIETHYTNLARERLQSLNAVPQSQSSRA